MARGRGRRRHDRMPPPYTPTRPASQSTSQQDDDMCAETLLRNHSNAWNPQCPATNGLDQEISETSNSPLTAPAVSHHKSRKKHGRASQQAVATSSALTRTDTATAPSDTTGNSHNNRSAPQPFPAHGYVWQDGRFYKLPERLFHVKNTAESWSSHGSSSGSNAGDLADSANAEDLEPTIKPSAFPSSPAMPPGAYLATMRTGAASLTAIPRNCAASSMISAQHRK